MARSVAGLASTAGGLPTLTASAARPHRHSILDPALQLPCLDSDTYSGASRDFSVHERPATRADFRIARGRARSSSDVDASLSATNEELVNDLAPSQGSIFAVAHHSSAARARSSQGDSAPRHSNARCRTLGRPLTTRS